MTPSEPAPGAPSPAAPTTTAAFGEAVGTKHCSMCGSLEPGPAGTSYRWRRHPKSRAVLCGPCGVRAVQQRSTPAPARLGSPASKEVLPAKRRRTAPVRPDMLPIGDDEEADRAGSAERQQPPGQAARAHQEQEAELPQARRGTRAATRCTACGSRQPGPRGTSYNWRRHPMTRAPLCGPCGAKVSKGLLGSLGPGEGQLEHQPGTPKHPPTTQVDAIGALLNLANGGSAAVSEPAPAAQPLARARPTRSAAVARPQQQPGEVGQSAAPGAGSGEAAAASAAPARADAAPPRRRGRPPKRRRVQPAAAATQPAASVQAAGTPPAAQLAGTVADAGLPAGAAAQVQSQAPQAIEQSQARQQQQQQQAPASEPQGWQAGWQEGWQAGWQAAMRQVESSGGLPWLKGEPAEGSGAQAPDGAPSEEGHDAVLRCLMSAQLADAEAEAQGLTIELVCTHQRQFEALSREQKRARAGPLTELLQARQYGKLAKFLHGLAG